jgi:nitrite reductase (NADH) large subunit
MNQAEQITADTSPYALHWQQLPTVIVGAGPVGQRLVAELRRHERTREIVLFGDEPWEPYDRVQLSSWLAGSLEELPVQRPEQDAFLHRYLGVRIARIDRRKRLLIDANGAACPYRELVLATGSRAFVPRIPGVRLPGVYTFRNLADAERLMARTVRSRHMVVVGGGLLGLETARALHRFNTRVTVIEQAGRLMFNQLDNDSAARLQEHVESTGIEVITGVRVVRILGETRIQGVQASDGRFIECDTVVIAAGITPNIELATACGLHTRRGVLVDDQLRTSDAQIFAAGECAEHRQTVYGLVAPGFEQAAVVAQTLCGHTAAYSGSISATRLKVLGLPVLSVGVPETEWSRRELVYHDRKDGVLRKLLLAGNRLDAAMSVGNWDEFSRVQEAVRTRQRVLPWQALRFRLTGTLWSDACDGGVAGWPATAMVCNCKGITRGTLTGAVDQGCASVACLAQQTGASSVCGSCRPLLVQLLGVTQLEPVRAARWLAGLALLAACAVVLFMLPFNIPYADSVQAELHVDELWRNGLFKQLSGFTLLGFAMLLAALSLRKRVARVSWGRFDGWRVLHVAAGALTLVVLLLHTGLRMGAQLNFWLMLVFAGLLLAGAAASASIGLQHALPLGLARRTRTLSVWSHIVLLWPLPALLGFHILKTYWY